MRRLPCKGELFLNANEGSNIGRRVIGEQLENELLVMHIGAEFSNLLPVGR